MRSREEKAFFEGSVELHALAAGLNRIFKSVQKTGLSEETMAAISGDVNQVATHFGICPKGAILLGFITEHHVLNGSDVDDLAAYVGCSNIEFIGFHEALGELEQKGITFRGSSRGRRTVFFLTREAAKCIEDGSAFVPKCWTGLTVDEFFSRVRMVFSDFRRDIIDAERVLESITSLVEGNQQLPFCQKVIESGLLTECPETHQRFFFYLCHRLVSFGDTAVPIGRLMDFTGYMEDDQRVFRNIATERTYLQCEGYVTFGGSDGFKDMNTLALTEDTIKRFLGDVEIIRRGEEEHPDVVKAASIAPKQLFYNEVEGEQMERLAALLDDANFKGVQARLSEMGMRKGFAVLFSGGAGCGKTAGVYELARRTGRDVFAVDMSQLKSKWVGDSEKIVKGVFSTYADMCRTREKAPILLFNEADAIFSKRFESPERSVDQMMNSIQNICLEAIENLDGILIATTNLAENFCDDAFARRFIFKVNFTTPKPEVRSKIWRSMIGSLSEEDAATLGSRYSFSGGNIENIARKSAVGYVLSGKEATLDDIIRYADEETLKGRKTRTAIGF